MVKGETLKQIKVKSHENIHECSTQEILCTLLQIMGCDSVEESICNIEVGQIPSVQADVGNESISMFLVKNEEEFLSVLGLGEETSND